MAAASLEEIVLQELNSNESVADSWPYAESLNVPHQEVVGVLKSLEADNYVDLENLSFSFYVLTEEAQGYLTAGSPEVQVFRAVPAEGIAAKDLMPSLPKMVYKIGFGKCMKNKWLKNNKAEGTIERLVEDVDDELVAQLSAIQENGGEGVAPAVLKDLSKRSLLQSITRKSYAISKGTAFQLQRKKLATDLTREMLTGDAWKDVAFKPYNFSAAGKDVAGGHLHLLMKVRAEFRRILLDMGFAEMPTNRFVESSFWNFDSLFQPQSHPARDMHDTFFLKDPSTTLTVPEDYLERVRKVHQEGGYGSIGYRYEWKREEGMKNLLRTHTTAVSARMLYKLANQPGGFKPQKYFSIDRVFRNETLDATHLAEFHQVEGVVADYNLSLGDLIGVIAEFFRRIGITKLRFKPAYNPYTEPSMEIFGYHPDLKKWSEIGNSGVFRPEMLEPMGLPKDVKVIAWGLSLERPTMIKYRFSNIRDLFGHKVKVEMAKNAPICRFKGEA